MPTVLDWFGLIKEKEMDNEVWNSDRPKTLLPILEKGILIILLFKIIIIKFLFYNSYVQKNLVLWKAYVGTQVQHIEAP